MEGKIRSLSSPKRKNHPVYIHYDTLRCNLHCIRDARNVVSQLHKPNTIQQISILEQQRKRYSSNCKINLCYYTKIICEK